MDSLLIAVLITSLVQSFSQAIVYKLDRKDMCKTLSGRNQCIEATKCKTTATDLAFGRKPVICGWKGQVPKVCCACNKEVENNKITPRISRISPKGCGIRTEPYTGNEYEEPNRNEDSSYKYQSPPEINGYPENDTYDESWDDQNNSSSFLNPGFEAFAVGGLSATIPWPWMAAIFVGSTTKQLCGGVLIDERHVLTAAHCFVGLRRNPKDFKIMVGKISLYDSYSKLVVEAMKIHEGYDSRYYYNDIAIMRLAEPLTDATPVCLPEEIALNAGDNCTLLGWGDLSFGGPSTLTLQEVPGLPVVPHKECDAKYKKVSARSFPRGITDTFLCAGLDEGGKDACQGDSGGPLLYQDLQSKAWHTVGVVSFGYGCAEPGFPGVYTKVSAFSKWIESYVDSYNTARTGTGNVRTRTANVRTRTANIQTDFRRPRWRPIEKIIFPE